MLRHFTLGLSCLLLAGCTAKSQLPPDVGFGPQPHLPPPDTSAVPVVHIALAKGWKPNEKPTVAEGLSVERFAVDLAHPRWLYVLPNGDVLVAETAAPPRPKDNTGAKGWAMSAVMKVVGASVPSANRITLLRDRDGDGIVEVRSVFLEGLNSPFGMTLVGNDLYIANTDAIVRVPYREGETKITATPTKVADLPGGPINHHWTKNVIASPDGTKLYATAGSNSNIAENGIENEQGRAAIWQVDRASGERRLFATGLRNPNGMAWVGDQLWTCVNERDELGNDLVPDYMTTVRDGGFYGWPYSYYGAHVDERVKPARPDLVARAIVPDYALGAHTAALGLAFSESNRLSAALQRGMFVGLHGSWNRKPRNGYKVIFVPFRGDRPVGEPIDVLTDFVKDDEARGRPVGVALDRTGALLVADDVGNIVWRVRASGS